MFSLREREREREHNYDKKNGFFFVPTICMSTITCSRQKWLNFVSFRSRSPLRNADMAEENDDEDDPPEETIISLLGAIASLAKIRHFIYHI